MSLARPTWRRVCAAGLFLSIAAASFSAAAQPERIELRRVTLDLPGKPASIVPTDLDGDGRVDLVIVSDFSEVESTVRDSVQDGVQRSEVSPVLEQRREVRAWLARADGGYRATAVLPLPLTVHTLEAGPPGWPAIVSTDEGLSVLRVDEQLELRLEPVRTTPSALAGTEVFLADLELSHDLDGDGDPDLLFPAASGLQAWIDPAAGGPVHEISGLADETHELDRRVPWPRVTRVDGDERPDLVVFDRQADPPRLRVRLGRADGSFGPLRPQPVDCHDRDALRLRADPERGADEPAPMPWPADVMTLRDLDGDGRAELIRRRRIEREGDGLRASLREARRPRFRLDFHRVEPNGFVAREPYSTLEVEGHMFEDAGQFTIDPFVDLDGDGHEEMVLITLRFSILQALRIMATKTLSIGLDFNVYRQDAEGHFRPVKDLDLSERLKLNLRKLSLKRFAQFAGDFDGDGIRDFVHFGRGREITIHRGALGVSYPDRPDLAIPLDYEADSLDLIRVKDLDGDRRSDIAIVFELERDDPDENRPVRLDLYLSRAVR